MNLYQRRVDDRWSDCSAAVMIGSACMMNYTDESGYRLGVILLDQISLWACKYYISITPDAEHQNGLANYYDISDHSPVPMTDTLVSAWELEVLRL